MAKKFQDLSIDYKKLMKLTISDRMNFAQSQEGQSYLASLTPAQLAAMFPTYYKKQLPDLGQALSGGAPSSSARSGTSAPQTATPEGSSAAPAAPSAGTKTEPKKSGEVKESWLQRLEKHSTDQKKAEAPKSDLAVGEPSKPGAWNTRKDVPYDGRPASVRYNNPGASWSRQRDELYGVEGYGMISGNNRIGKFPTIVHGMASNMDLFSTSKHYVGKSLQQATYTWRGNRPGNVPSFKMSDGTVIDGRTVITSELLKNEEFMYNVFKSYAQHEAGLKGTISDDQVREAFRMYNAGGVENYKKEQEKRKEQQTIKDATGVQKGDPNKTGKTDETGLRPGDPKPKSDEKSTDRLPDGLAPGIVKYYDSLPPDKRADFRKKVETAGVETVNKYYKDDTTSQPVTPKDAREKTDQIIKGDPKWQKFTGADTDPRKAKELGISSAANAGSNMGLLSADRQGRNLTEIVTQSGAKFKVNKEVAGNYAGFLRELESRGYHIDPKSGSYGFSYRMKRGASGLSEHAFGNAIDVDPKNNTDSAGGRNRLPPDVAQIAKRYGLTWGGLWNRKDTHHFEWNPTHGVTKQGDIAAFDEIYHATVQQNKDNYPNYHLFAGQDKAAADKNASTEPTQEPKKNSTGDLLPPNPAQPEEGATPVEGETVREEQQSATRKLAIDPRLKDKVEEAVLSVYGPGYKAEVYSGGQPGIGTSRERVGSTRHDHGLAADIRIRTPDGKVMSRDQQAPLIQYWANKNYGGVGVGMAGGGLHLDIHKQNGVNAWGYKGESNSWNYLSGAEQQAIMTAKKEGFVAPVSRQEFTDYSARVQQRTDQYVQQGMKQHEARQRARQETRDEINKTIAERSGAPKQQATQTQTGNLVPPDGKTAQVKPEAPADKRAAAPQPKQTTAAPPASPVAGKPRALTEEEAANYNKLARRRDGGVSARRYLDELGPVDLQAAPTAAAVPQPTAPASTAPQPAAPQSTQQPVGPRPASYQPNPATPTETISRASSIPVKDPNTTGSTEMTPLRPVDPAKPGTEKAPEAPAPEAPKEEKGFFGRAADAVKGVFGYEEGGAQPVAADNATLVTDTGQAVARINTNENVTFKDGMMDVTPAHRTDPNDLQEKVSRDNVAQQDSADDKMDQNNVEMNRGSMQPTPTLGNLNWDNMMGSMSQSTAPENFHQTSSAKRAAERATSFNDSPVQHYGGFSTTTRFT